MKLRLRSFESKETLKIEVSNSCTLPQFKQILSQTLPNSPSPASIRLSLNRKDDLQSDGEDPLHSLGITAGDLVFFSLEQPAAAGMSSNSQINLSPEADSTLGCIDSECSTSLNTQNTLPQSQNSDVVNLESKNTDTVNLDDAVNLESQNSDAVNVDWQKGKTLDEGSQIEEVGNDMEVDDEGNENGVNSDTVVAEAVDKSFSVPGFLRKVFMEELGDDSGRDHKLIVTAVHAVMLESGFVAFDKNANMVVDGFHLRDDWSLGLHRMSFLYTLPGSPSGSSGESVKKVLLKFQSFGKFMNVYGKMEGGSGKKVIHRAKLNEDQLVAYLNVVWANCGAMEFISGNDGGVLETSPEKEVFTFWRTVKDSLALPLLIDLCEEAGLQLPPCFMRLPTDLKLKILEFLPGVELAKVSCVSSELRYLGASDDLWNLKFAEEFSNEKKEAQWSWKKAFATAWERQKNRKFASRVRASPYWPAPYWPQPRRRRYPNPFMVPRVPRIIGDDLDIPPPFGADLQLDHPMRNFSPRCNLGVRGGRFV